MSVSAINSYAVKADRPLSASMLGGSHAQPTKEEIHKAAEQFEAIIIRQLVTPAIEPVMKGLDGQSSGGGVYGYMLTDTLAGQMAKGRGMGLATMLEKQFTPAVRGGATSSTALKLQNHSKVTP